MSKKWAQQLGKDALDFIDKATTDHWWEYVIEAVPVAGDAYGAGKLGKQGYTVWKGLEKFKKVAELGERAAKVSWKKLGSNLNLKGKGSDKLIDFINDVNKNIGEKLNDNTLAGAIKEKFGLNSGFKPDGTPFKHLNSANDRLRGLDNKIKDLSEDIFKNDSFDGETLDSAKKILKNLESQRDKIKEALKSADKAVEKMGKIE
jgi:hypothetical protein